MSPGQLVRRASCAAVVWSLAAAFAPAADAQVWVSGAGDTPRRGSWEVSGGALFGGGYDLGARTATLTRNPPTGASAFELFTSDTRLDARPGAQARVAVYLSRRLALEGGLRFSRPVLTSRLADDAEGAEPVTATGTLTRYEFEGAGVFHLLGLAFAGGRGVPFVTAGGGYLRELHAGNELVETGTTITAGGGVKLWFGGGRRRVGLRGEAGMTVRNGGFDFDEGRRALPTAAVSLLLLF